MPRRIDRQQAISVVGWARLAIQLVVVAAVIDCAPLRDAESAEAAEQTPQWIWGRTVDLANDQPETCHFQRRFQLQQVDDVQSAELRITCDDRYVLRVNDRLVGIDRDWQTLDRFDVHPALRTGENRITVVAGNDGAAAGLLCQLKVTFADHSLLEIISDASWQAAVQASGTWDPTAVLQHNWRAAVELGPWPGAQPWEDRVQVSEHIRQLKANSLEHQSDGLQLVDGDRVVLVGNTMIERAQQNDYWETRLTTQFPGRKIQFRNLGWSGDTVFGHARARFGSVEDGFEHLEVQVHSLEPTVILIAYGANESYAGPDGLEEFAVGLQRLVQALAPTGARLILLTPIAHENMGDPLPDPTPLNHNRNLYRRVIEELAVREGLGCVNLAQVPESVDSPGHHLTYNGIHLSPSGYYQTGQRLAEQLGCSPSLWWLDLDAKNRSYDAQGVTVEQLQWEPNVIRMRLVSRRLPYVYDPEPGNPALGSTLPGAMQVMRTTGLTAGRYRLEIDDHPYAEGSSSQWADGLEVRSGPDVVQAQSLRRQIIRKNELFFHRWRPENETYLFLFRKHEQGNNAIEIPQFDPLIAAAEQQIQALSRPQPHAWVLRIVGQD